MCAGVLHTELHTDFHLQLVGRLVNITEIELRIKRLIKLLEFREGADGGNPEEDHCLDRRRAIDSETMPEDTKLRSKELSSATLRSELDKNKAERMDLIGHLRDSYDEVFRDSSFAYFPVDGPGMVDHCHRLIAWLKENRQLFIRLRDQRAILEKEPTLNRNTRRMSGSSNTRVVSESCQLAANLEKRVKNIWRLQTNFRDHLAQESRFSEEALSSKLSVFGKALKNVQLIRQQSAAFRKYCSPLAVQTRLNDELASCLSKIQSGLLNLQTAHLACDADIVALKEGFKAAIDAVPFESPTLSPPSVNPIAIEQSDMESAVNSIVREAFEKMRKEHVEWIFEGFPSGNANPNQQYAWRLLQTTFLIIDEEIKTATFKRTDPDLSGPMFSGLY